MIGWSDVLCVRVGGPGCWSKRRGGIHFWSSTHPLTQTNQPTTHIQPQPHQTNQQPTSNTTPQKVVAETFGAHDFMVYHTEIVRPYTGPHSEPAPPNAKLAARDIFVEGLREIEVAWRGGLFATAEPDDPDRFGPGAREDAQALLMPAAARLAGAGEDGEEGAAAAAAAGGRWVEEQYRWLQAQQTLSVLEIGGGGGGGGAGGKKGAGSGAAGGAAGLAAVSAALEAAEAPRRRKKAEKGRKVKKLRALEKIRR